MNKLLKVKALTISVNVVPELKSIQLASQQGLHKQRDVIKVFHGASKTEVLPEIFGQSMSGKNVEYTINNYLLVLS